MSIATLTPSPGDFDNDDLAAFLATVPAAADFNHDDQFTESVRRRVHRPGRQVAKREAIKSSLDINSPYRTSREV